MRIKEYIKKIKELETSLYYQELVINHIQDKINDLEFYYGDYDESELDDFDARWRVMPRKKKSEKNILQVIFSIGGIIGFLICLFISVFIGAIIQYMYNTYDILRGIIRVIGLEHGVLSMILVGCSIYLYIVLKESFYNDDTLEGACDFGMIIGAAIGAYLSYKIYYTIFIIIPVILLLWELIMIIIKYISAIREVRKTNESYETQMSEFYYSKAWERIRLMN